MNETAETQQPAEPAPPRELATPSVSPTERKLWAVVDGDSASYGSSSPGERASLAKLRAVLDELVAAGIPHDVVVASYTWNLKGFREGFDKFAKERGVIVAPTTTKTDDLVLQTARKRRAQGYEVYLVSNDGYKEYPRAKDFPRIGFAVTRDGLVLTSPEVHELAKTSPGNGAAAGSTP